MRHLILFDIDGTLLNSSSAGRTALRAAFADEFTDLDFFDAVRFDGKTDPQIVVELFDAAGVPDRATPPMISAVIDRYLAHLDAAVSAGRHKVRSMVGVPELLAALHAKDDVVVGLLTGNVIPGARIKLEAAGLPFAQFALGAFGSDSPHRPDLPAVAAARADQLMGRVPSGRDVVIIGDTPADVTCGAAICAHAIGVATGAYSTSALHAAGASATFETLADTDRVMEAILCLNLN